MTIISTNGPIPYPAPQATGKPARVELPIQPVPANLPAVPVKERSVEAQGNFDLARIKAIREALANMYAVSDVRFTIYKQNGESYTRITSLRDGNVHTIPEPDIISMGGGGAGSFVETVA